MVQWAIENPGLAYLIAGIFCALIQGLLVRFTQKHYKSLGYAMSVVVVFIWPLWILGVFLYGFDKLRKKNTTNNSQ